MHPSVRSTALGYCSRGTGSATHITFSVCDARFLVHLHIWFGLGKLTVMGCFGCFGWFWGVNPFGPNSYHNREHYSAVLPKNTVSSQKTKIASHASSEGKSRPNANNVKGVYILSVVLRRFVCLLLFNVSINKCENVCYIRIRYTLLHRRYMFIKRHVHMHIFVFDILHCTVDICL